jgi:hypothetical protein
LQERSQGAFCHPPRVFPKNPQKGAEKPKKMPVNPLLNWNATLKTSELPVNARGHVAFQDFCFSHGEGVEFYFLTLSIQKASIYRPIPGGSSRRFMSFARRIILYNIRYFRRAQYSRGITAAQRSEFTCCFVHKHTL